MRKTLFFFALLLSTQSALAHYAGVTAPGAIVLKNKAGDIVKYDVSLFVPEKGKGQVVLTDSTGKTYTAHAFQSKHDKGRVVFSVLFLNPPGFPKKTAAIMVGTYVRGNNKALYYGDIFSRPYRSETEEELSLQMDGREATYLGGFMFSADVH